jgi:cytochrome c553
MRARSIASRTGAAERPLGVPLLAAACLAAAATAGASAQTAPAAVAPAAERFATCLGCHGPGGVSATPLVPSLAGQHGFYAITQLFLFRQERRDNEVMRLMAKDMSDIDLRAFSDLIAKLPPAPPPAASTDATRMARGRAVAQRYRCGSCHGEDYAGGGQVPRVAGQREDYLAQTLAAFAAGRRIGYTPAMNEVMTGIQPEEVADLAHFLAHGAR